MTPVVMWLLALLFVVVPLVLAALSRWKRRSGSRMTSETVALHAIRRRIEVAQFESEVKAEAARAQRRLRRELDGWEEPR